MLGTEKLVDYSLVAGEAALAAYAYEDAEHIYRTALAAINAEQMNEPVADLTAGLGMALGGSLRWPKGWQNLARAFDYYEAAGLTEKALAIAMFPSANAWGRGLSGPVPVLERAVELAEPKSPQLAHILATLGTFLGLDEGEVDRAVDVLGQALQLAEDLGDRRLQMRTLAHWAQIDMILRYRPSEGLPKAIRAAKLAAELGDAATESFARFHAAFGRMSAEADLEEAVAEAGRAREAAERSRVRQSMPTALYLAGFIDVNRGRIEEGIDLNRRALELAPEDDTVHGFSAVAYAKAGRLDLADRHLDETRKRIVGARGPLLLSAYASAASHRLWVKSDPQLTVQCEQAADTAMEQWERLPLRSAFAVAAKGRIAVIKGEAAAARSAYERFKEIVGDEVRMFFEDNDQLLGTFAVSFGDFDLAEEHFARAILRLDQAGSA